MAEKTPLEKEAAQRLADCRRQKSFIDVDLRESYFFTAPHRCRDVTSQTRPADRARETDAGELQTSLGIECAQDFATEMLNTFTPEVLEWAQQKAGIDLNADEWEQAREQVETQTTTIMDAIKASNFYPCAAMAYMPDLSLGTVGLWISDLRANEPVVCQAVPLREMEINIGPYGEVDDRFIVRHTRYRHLPALLPGVELPADVAKKVKEKGNEPCTVSWGWWRLWGREDNVYWQAVVRVGEKVVQDATLKGAGSCPFIVSRFNPDTLFAFGQGPTMQCLPELRSLDEIEALKIENADFQIHPAFGYQDDGVINLSAGIEPGMGYPFRPTTGQPFHSLAFEGNVNFAEFETIRREQRVRRMFFADYPEQIGKTPPTAEQWIDEMQRAKRRIGTPGKIFFKEGPAEIFQRFKYILEVRGVIEPIEIDGKTVALVPYDPTEQAQEFQEVQVADRILSMARNHFPETMQVEVDGSATLANIKKKLRDKVVILRTPNEIAAAVQQFAPVLGGGAQPPAGPLPGGGA